MNTLKVMKMIQSAKISVRCLTSTNTIIKHVPVLTNKVLDYLEPTPGKIYIDMTFGAGGHTKQLLKACDDVKVYALDRDPIAYEHAKELSKEYPERLIPMLGRFSELNQALRKHDQHHNSVDGILFDFGCSSMQFDEANRGFSVSKDGPLDMRMDRGRFENQVTAADVLNKADELDLVKIFRIYGEEKAAKKIASAIVEARSLSHKIETTKQLADLVDSCFAAGFHRIDKLQRTVHSATKVFQALRIFVNNELNEINYGMILAHRYLKVSGRVVTITFHSLEDTIVKRHIHGNVINGMANHLPLKYCNHEVIHDQDIVKSLVDSNWKQLHKHVIVPENEEIVKNPRSRSAKLRAATKIK